MQTPYLAVARLSFGNLPVQRGYPPMEHSFATQDQAREWLRSRGGGAISTHRDGDFRVIEHVPAGD
jgi:hypothetical protein